MWFLRYHLIVTLSRVSHVLDSVKQQALGIWCLHIPSSGVTNVYYNYKIIFSMYILCIWTKFLVILRKTFYWLNHLPSPPLFFLIKIILCSLFTYILIWLFLSLWRILTVDAGSDSHWGQWVNEESLQWVIVIGNQYVHFSLRTFRDIQDKQCRSDNKAISYNSCVYCILENVVWGLTKTETEKIFYKMEKQELWLTHEILSD